MSCKCERVLPRIWVNEDAHPVARNAASTARLALMRRLPQISNDRRSHRP